MAINRPFDLLVIGEVNPDLILSGDIEPAFGQVEKIIEDALLTVGSSSCIFACGAARLGLKVAFVGKIGDDEFGRFMHDKMVSYGINTQGLIIDGRTKTGLSVILSRGTDRAILTYQGAIPNLNYEEIDLGMVAQARHLHMGGFFLLRKLQPHVAELFKIARSEGLSTSLDTNFDPSERWNDGLAAVLMETDIFLPNEIELRSVAGLDDVYRGMKKIAGSDRIVAVKLGAKGGLAYQGGNLVAADALSIQVVDTTGAGDTFDAGFIYGFLNKWDLQRCLQFACVCGSLSTQAVGGTTAQPTLEEALERMP